MLLAFLKAVAAIPAIWDMLKTIMGKISDGIATIEENRAKKQLNDAIDQAKQTKDTSGLDKMFNPDGEK